jgi:hypothetical protein
MNDAFSSPIPSRMKQAMRMLDRWYFAATADGTLWIQPRRSPVPVEECCALLTRLSEIVGTRPLRTLVLDLGDAQIPEDRWPVLLGIVGVVAEKMKAGVRIMSYADPYAGEGNKPQKSNECLRMPGTRATSAAQMKSSCIVLDVPVQVVSRAMPA